MKVVFCGKMMYYGFQFSKNELEPDPSFLVIQCASEDVKKELADADIAIPLMTALTAEILENAPKLKLVLQFGAGIEAIDIQTATKLGIYVSNIPSAGTGNSTSCAEMAIFLSMATLRNINGMATSISTKQLGVPLGQMLFNKTVLVVGFGSIAKELISRLSAFGVTINALRRSNKWNNNTDKSENNDNNGNNKVDSSAETAESLLAEKGTWPGDSARLAATADIIILTCKQDTTNLGMINAEFLKHCKDGVRIVNVARGGLLNYNDVLEALNSGKVGGCGLDVQFWEPFDPEDPIATHPNVYLTPHVAGVTETSYRAMGKIVAEEARRISRGERPTIQLNSEEDMRKEGAVPRV